HALGDAEYPFSVGDGFEHFKEHGREKRAYTRRNYNPGNYNIAKEDRFIRDEFSTTVYIRN
ncbi:MAG TPA: hypothetical protein QF571_11855, partial [Desulfobacterales bacterium]|nr:hypothetical protein [Desulfobacterales bacterium]